MRNLLSHFQPTPKAAGAFVVAGVGMLSAFKFLTVEQAEAIGVFVTAVLACLVPQRPATDLPQEGQESKS